MSREVFLTFALCNLFFSELKKNVDVLVVPPIEAFLFLLIFFFLNCDALLYILFLPFYKFSAVQD